MAVGAHQDGGELLRRSGVLRGPGAGDDVDAVGPVGGCLRGGLVAAGDDEYAAGAAEEFGDLLFVLVNLGRWMGVNAEEALRRANDKFLTRFEAMERAIVARGGKLRGMSLEEMDAVWDEMKGTSR